MHELSTIGAHSLRTHNCLPANFIEKRCFQWCLADVFLRAQGIQGPRSRCLVHQSAWVPVHPQNVRFQNVRIQNDWNVRFTKRQVYKMSGLQNVRSSKRPVAKKTSLYILYLWLVEIRRFCSSHVCSQSDGCVLFSILEVFLAIYHHNK